MTLAKDIKDCDDCPLYKKGCSGGVSGSPNGPIEPPCASWDEDTEVSETMYC